MKTIHPIGARAPRAAWLIGVACIVWAGVGGASALPGGGEAVLYVSPQGRDGQAGTRQQPLATLDGARLAVQKLLAGGHKDVVRVVLNGGVYRITRPVEFGPADSAPAGQTITYTAAPGEAVTITGGTAITGWRDQGDGTWVAPAPSALPPPSESSPSQGREPSGGGTLFFRELFVNGERRQRARHPHGGFFRVVQAGPDHRTSFTFEPDDVPAGLAGPGSELLFLHDWSTSRVAVKAIDRATHTITLADAIGCRAPHYRIDNFEPHPRYALENDRSLLDWPGEWFLDTRAGKVLYRPKPGEAIDKIEAVAPVSRQLVIVHGEEGKPVTGLRFVGLRFAHCAWPTPAGGYAAGQAGFHERRDGSGGDELRELIPAAIDFELARGCRVEDCRVEHVGGSGVWIGGRCVDCALVGCVVSDVAGNGVLIGEDTARRVTPGGGAWWQAASDQAATNNAIRNCLIERCGQLYMGCVGVWVGLAQGTAIEHNEIREMPYTGVSIGWMWNPTPTPCRETRVEHNDIHHAMLVLSDGGCIYTLGRQPGTVLAHNLIHDVPPNAGRAESNGMFLDEGTTEIVIEGNVIYGIARSPLRFHQARHNLVRHNTLVVGEGVPPVRYNSTDAKDIEMVENAVPAASKWDESNVTFRDAGLEPAYRARLLTGPR
jgi:Right handed beta helix region/GH141 insertion domain